jgi:uncharacterized protein (TIGR03083 family)
MSGEVEVEVWDAERDEMRDLAERLDEIDDEQWNSPSLCAQWRIRDVLAHLTAGAEGAYGFGWILRSTLRHGINYNRWVAADGRRRGQPNPRVTLQTLRSAAASRNAPPRTRPVRGLMHVLIHGQDMCRPLGITRDLPEAHLVPVANLVKNDVHLFGAKTRIAGLKLTATDMDWSHGSGPEVTGPAEALVMMMAGRSVALGDLSGEGTSALLAER